MVHNKRYCHNLPTKQAIVKAVQKVGDGFACLMTLFTDPRTKATVRVKVKTTYTTLEARKGLLACSSYLSEADRVAAKWGPKEAATAASHSL